MAEHHEVNEIVKRINKDLLEKFFTKPIVVS